MIKKEARNNALYDRWSMVHFMSSGALCWLLNPLWAFMVTTLWEPFELFILSPLLAKKGITFGYETWRNSLSDIAFNSVGIVVAVALKSVF